MGPWRLGASVSRPSVGPEAGLGGKGSSCFRELAGRSRVVGRVMTENTLSCAVVLATTGESLLLEGGEC